MSNVITMYNFNAGYIHYYESIGLAKIFFAYANHAEFEVITMIGFNQNTGCVYIALENGICINSILGQSVFYTTNNDEDQEQRFSSYAQAIKYLEHAEYLRGIQDGTHEAAQDIRYEDEGDNPYSISFLF